ncbi:uncharacterized protein RCC_04639 [Ramularia collo-cygni]|uniref:BTB domain-containing protein n=1 Tax=Ramularia collo-cygni TaxID=112498 RepID=A0A2D3UWW4_9PEZI|nr:uncharacterized protein RCC_04639 [Ramularia collo-cygni]CZT18795.1 uncharacterized protein RCC_04639 [Ramularia collo-cygni]
MEDEHKQAFANVMSNLLLNHEWTDMTIICEGGARIECHRAIVYPQSSVFRDLSKRRTDSIFDENEFELPTIKRMYLYNQDYEPYDEKHSLEGPVLPSHSATASLIAHADVHAAAVYFDIPLLQVKAVEKFEQVLWNNDLEKESLPLLLETIWSQSESQNTKLREAIIFVVRHYHDYLFKEGNIRKFKDKEVLLDCCFAVIERLILNLNTAHKENREALEALRAKMMKSEK